MPTRSPARPARKTGRQSATSTAQTTPRVNVTAASAGACAAAGSTATPVPCTCSSQAGSAGSPSAVAQAPAVFGHGRGVVADVGREVEARVGAGAHAAGARRHGRAHARGRAPAGREELRLRHQASAALRSRFSAAMSALRSAGKRRLDLDRAAVARMRKNQLRRMQRLPPETVQGLGERGRRAARNREAPAVHRVADQRIARMRKVQADLVRASRLQRDAHPGVAAEALDHAVIRDGLAPALAHRHAHPVDRMAVDRRVDPAARRSSRRRTPPGTRDGSRAPPARRRAWCAPIRCGRRSARPKCPCRGDGRCRRAAASRGADRGRAARSAACGPDCRRRDARRARPACRRPARPRPPRRRRGAVPARRPGRRPRRARRGRFARRRRRCRAAAARGRRRAACRRRSSASGASARIQAGRRPAPGRGAVRLPAAASAVRVGDGWNSCGSGAVFCPVYCVDSTAGVQSFAASQNDGAHPPDRVRHRRSRGLRLQGARSRATAAEPHVREGARPAAGRRLPRRRALLRGARGALPVQPGGPPGAPRHDLCVLPRPRAGIRGRCGRPVRARESDAPARRLCDVPAGPHLLRALAELPRALVQHRPQRAPAPGRQARVRRLRPADPRSARTASTRTMRASAWCSCATASPTTRSTWRTTTCGARPTSRRSTARATASRTTTGRRQSARRSRS